MADTQYTYSISGDFSNQEVDAGALGEEIEDSSITSALFLYVITNGDDCDIWFDDPLSGGDQTVLDGVVAAHQGNPLYQGASAPNLVSDPDVSVLYEGDFWYSSNEIRFYNGSEIVGLSGVSPAEFSRAQSLGASTTTSTSWQQKLRLSVLDIPAGTYRIGVSFVWAYTNASRNFQGRVQIDDTTTIWEIIQEPADAGTDQRCPAAGFSYVALSAGDHDIDLDFRSSSFFDTAGIARAHIEFWRVG